ncbi:MAG: hypothetical protein H0X59_06695 [Chloroflexi bacterium]|nr:hypothetical protein [Chloroflexota bacterium]
MNDHLATLRADRDAYRRFAAALLDEGVHLIPRGLLYVSAAHSQADLDETREAVRRAATRVRAGLEARAAVGAPHR